MNVVSCHVRCHLTFSRHVTLFHMSHVMEQGLLSTWNIYAIMLCHVVMLCHDVMLLCYVIICNLFMLCHVVVLCHVMNYYVML